MICGDDYIIQTLRLRSGAVSSENPFQDDGIGIRAVFQNISDPGWIAQQRRQIELIFKQFERNNLAKLRSVSFKPSTTDPSEFEAIIRFLSIETNTEREVPITVRRT